LQGVIFCPAGREYQSMKKALFFLYLFVGLIIFLISIYGFFLLRQRPGLPLPPEVNYDFI